MDVRIEAYRDADESGVFALWRQVFDYPDRRHEPSYVLAEKLTQDDGLLLVAREAGRVVGTAMGGYDGHRGWLYTVAVDPGRRRAGIGSALVAAMERALLAAGAPKVNLQVRAGNEAVMGFYESLGYSREPHTSMGKVARGIVPARAADVKVMAELLAEAGLSTEDLRAHLGTTLVAREEGAVMGCAALEVLGDVGLLRSVCVTAPRRGGGLGRALIDEAVVLARQHGLDALYLLTETAADFFASTGFSPCSRQSLPGAVAATRQVRELCPDSAEAMLRRLA